MNNFLDGPFQTVGFPVIQSDVSGTWDSSANDFKGDISLCGPSGTLICPFGYIDNIIKIPKNLNLWVLIPAAITTLPAVISGQNSKKNLENICLEAQNTLKNHELFANITTWSILLLSIIWIYITLKGHANLKVQKLLCAFLSLVFISAMITGFLGGQLTHLWEV